jgi:hypothetical protein
VSTIDEVAMVAMPRTAEPAPANAQRRDAVRGSAACWESTVSFRSERTGLVVVTLVVIDLVLSRFSSSMT